MAISKKSVEEQQLSVKQIGLSFINTLNFRQQLSVFPLLFFSLAFVLCILLSVATLSRIPDPVLRLQAPLGIQLAQFGAWLPDDLGLTTDHQASQLNTNMIEFLLLIGVEFAIYGMCALFISRQPVQGDNRSSLRFIWLGAVVAGCIYVFTPAALSHDVIAYASYGRLIVTYHVNPYFVTLAAYPKDPFYAIDYWARTISAYGPVWIAVCSFFALFLRPDPIQYFLAFRLFALAAHLCNILLVTAILSRMGRSPRTIALGTLLYAWNPLVLFESSNGGHNDIFVVTLMLLGILLALRAEQKGFTRPRNYLPPLLAFILATLVKFTTVPIIIFFIILLVFKILRPTSALNSRQEILHRWWSALLTVLSASSFTCIIVLLLYAPFWIHQKFSDIAGSFTAAPSMHFSENSILRAIIEWEKVHTLSSHTLKYTLLHLFHLHYIWDEMSTTSVALGIVLGAIWLWYRPTIRTLILATLATLGALLLVTPWFFAWYITWLVGLAVICLPVTKDRFGRALIAFSLTFSASAFLTYLYLYGYPPIGKWMGFAFLTTLGPPLLVFLIFLIGGKPSGQPAHPRIQPAEKEKVGA